MGRKNRGKEIKGKHTKDKPKCVIYIFCEGDTEKIYLRHFENRSYNVKIVPVESGHTDALGIVKFAKRYIETNELNLELGDRGYCVFDSDPASNPNSKIKEAFNILKDSRIKGLDCIFSNPSFEVWFVLHFRIPPFGMSATQMKDCIKGLLRDKLPQYSETTDIYDYISDNQMEALKRAEQLHRAQEAVHDTVYSHECNPYTDIFRFLNYMQEIKDRNLRVK